MIGEAELWKVLNDRLKCVYVCMYVVYMCMCIYPLKAAVSHCRFCSREVTSVF